MKAKIKQEIKNIMPPSLLQAKRKIFAAIGGFKYSSKKFVRWWNNFKLSANLDKEIVDMVDIFIETETFQGMSNYWNSLNKRNLEQLSKDGFENFKQTVACNYYTWVEDTISGVLGENLSKNLDDFKTEIPINQIIKKHEFFNVNQSIMFNIMTVLLYNHIQDKYPELIRYCEESTIGNAPFIEIKGRHISQDILNSAIEYATIYQGRQSHPSSVLEIGAGSGRTAEFFLRKEAGKKYIICDIMPALFISQKYLSDIFAKREIFKFREFNNFSDVSDEFDNCEIGFIMPHQLKLLPKKYFDTCLAIDCLHEMKEDQISKYLSHADRLSKYFYFKVWINAVVHCDNVHLTKSSYKIPENWINIISQDCYIPSGFFEAMYFCGE